MPKLSYPPFLGSDVPPSAPGKALFHVIPAPYEKSVSYGHGTALGPSAILEASQQLETFDGISVPADKGIYTHPALTCAGRHEKAIGEIAKAVGKSLKLGKMPVVLGGEHTVTNGCVEALKEYSPGFGLVQFDAHADLRDEYEGSPWSHACVMRRAFEASIPIFQIGIRSLSVPEHRLRIEKKIPTLDASSIAASGIPAKLLPKNFPKKIFVTIDVDALDSSIMPSTGTPEPGGLSWQQMMTALQKVLDGREILGFDVVELAPVKGFHAPDFATARLIYNFMGMISRHRVRR
ncbi:MAG: agmatinase [Lentisphaerae bacterium GWF2_52_8]|nr:MAG: agmatinase [Lentisphaerae bacterium GWF2_52_8]